MIVNNNGEEALTLDVSLNLKSDLIQCCAKVNDNADPRTSLTSQNVEGVKVAAVS